MITGGSQYMEKQRGSKQQRINRKRQTLIIQKFFFLLTGIYGILLVIRSASSISFSAGLVFPVITLFCTGMYVLFHIRRKWFWPGTAGMFLVFGISAALQWDLFAEQTLALAGSLTGTELSDAVSGGEGFLSRSFQRITGRDQQSVADGHVSSGNNYRTGDTQLEVTVLEQPTETLYLKGFSGGEYTGGDWEPADDQAVFEAMAQTLQWDSWESWISGMYYSLYFSMNEMTSWNETDPDRTERNTAERYGETGGARIVHMNHIREGYDRIFTPYYGRWINLRESERPGYAFGYYEEGEMNIDWGNMLPAYEKTGEWYHEIQDAYMLEIPDFYTRVPEDILPGLTELCMDHPQDSLNEVTAFILDVLQSHASYTLTPGRAPVNQDIVEYFLFENHEGYCVHFAFAATLMYRLYGIPARYASGYAVEPSAFTQQEVIRFFSSPALIQAAFTVLAVCFLAVLFFLHCRRKKRIKKLKQMTEIVRRAAYGQTEPSEKETEFVRAVYCRTAEFLREKQRGFRKLRFRYTKAFY